MPAIVNTAANDVETGVDCMKNGAFDYLVKPIDSNRFTLGVERAEVWRSSVAEQRTQGFALL